MGLLDKAKEIAGQGAEAAKKAAEAAKDKAGEMNAKHKADELAEELGYLIVRERTEGADVAAEVKRLVDEIVATQAARDAGAADGGTASEG